MTKNLGILENRETSSTVTCPGNEQEGRGDEFVKMMRSERRGGESDGVSFFLFTSTGRG